MAPPTEEQTKICHMVAMPYLGRGHINPLMNICTLLTSSHPNILITFVVTEEWLGLIGSNYKPAENVNLATLPNVLPSEHVRGKDFTGFFEAVSTKLEDPFGQLLGRLEQPVSVILADVFLVWAAGFGNRTNVPVALFWPMSASMFSIVQHFDLVVENHHYPLTSSEDQKSLLVDYIPGIARTSVADVPFISDPIAGRDVLQRVLECISQVPKAQYLLHSSVYDLESQAIDTIKAAFPFPVYPVGPVIPYFYLDDNSDTPDYLQWLDSRPPASVLYISLGSFLSASSAQMDEIVAGVLDSGIQFLWVARGECSWLKDSCGDKGMVVPWCDQLKVLCHPSVGGFWTHCGWNSTIEGVYAGVPMLNFPLFSDQLPNSKQIVEDWKIGWRLRRELAGHNMIKRESIAETVRSFMDPENSEVAEMRKRANKLKEECLSAVAKGGSSVANIDAFINGLV